MYKFQQYKADERLCTKLGSTVISHGNLPYTLIYRNDSISQFYIYDLLYYCYDEFTFMSWFHIQKIHKFW